MTHRFADTLFTDSVKAAQTAYGSRDNNERLQTRAGPNDQLGPKEVAFIGERDTFFMATVSESGWPYVQHRGGPKGFLRVLNPGQVAYADFRGNTQLISVGNVSVDSRCSLILMDYPRRKRLKILGHLKVEDVADVSPERIARVALDDYIGQIERIMTIDVVAFDWNCPQHITRRYTEEEFAAREAAESA